MNVLFWEREYFSKDVVKVSAPQWLWSGFYQGRADLHTPGQKWAWNSPVRIRLIVAIISHLWHFFVWLFTFFQNILVISELRKALIIIMVLFNWLLSEQRSSHQRCPIKKSVHKNFAMLKGKQLRRSLVLITLQASRPAALLKRNFNTDVFLLVLQKF